jgi:methyl-accepting chemotaxis protein
MNAKKESAGARERRRRLIVDKPFQYRLVALLGAVWVAGAVFYSAVFYFLLELYLKRFYELVPRPGVSPALSMPAALDLTIAVICLFGLAVVIIVGVYLSFQIAGPIYRLKKSFERVSEGELEFELRFRHRDFLADLPEHFNRMLGALRSRSAAEVEALKEIESRLEDRAPAREKVQLLLRSLESRTPPGFRQVG